MNRRRRIQFWGSNEDDDSLIREVLSGAKTATACLAEEYDVPTGEYDDGGYEVGQVVDVFDLRERWRCSIRVTEIYPFRFGHIPERLWRGENCADEGHFQEAHRKCWPQHRLPDDRELMAMHFALLAVPHEQLNLPPAPSGYESRMRRHEEAGCLLSAGLDAYGREVLLAPEALQAWRAMGLAAGKDGLQLLLLSGFRSIARQAEILSRKLEGGAELSEILRVNAYPGYSEHHTGRAIDIGSPFGAHFEEDFERTPEYAWLEKRAAEFGFSLSYPRENECGIVFEPWHWCFQGEALTERGRAA